MGTAAPISGLPVAEILLPLVLLGVVLLPLALYAMRTVRARIRFMRRFTKPPLPIAVGDRVVTALGFAAEVVSVSAQTAEVRLEAGDGTTVISVFRGDILERISAAAGRS